MDFGLRRYGCLFTLCAFLLAAESSVAKATPPEESLASGTPAVAAPDGAYRIPIGRSLRRASIRRVDEYPLDAGRRSVGDVHAGRIFHGGDRPMPGEERCRYDQHEPDGVCVCLPGLLVLRIRAMGWGNLAHGTTASGWQLALGPGVGDLDRGGGFSRVVESGQAKPCRRLQVRLDRPERFFSQRAGRSRSDGPVLLHHGVDGDDRQYSRRGHGGEVALEEFLSVWALGGVALFLFLPIGFGAVDGWRRSGLNWGLGHGAVDFAGSGVVRPGRPDSRAGRRHGCSGRGSASIVTANRSRPRAPRAHGAPGNFDPGVWVARFQSGFGCGGE